MLANLIGTLIGAILSILTTMLIEKQRRPKLSLSIESPPADLLFSGGSKGRVLRIFLSNSPLPKKLNWISRDVALQCFGEICFYHASDGTAYFSKPMPIRWTGSEEPFTDQILGGTTVHLFDISKYHAAFKRDCFPGIPEAIDVVGRFDNDVDCYGYSNDSYLPGKNLRNDDWKLPPGRYLITVRIYTAGESILDAYKLENLGNRVDFRLLKANKEDKEKLGLLPKK